MDFCDHDAPWGHVGRVRDVLSFLTYVASLPTPEEHPGMCRQEWSGLGWILTACRETLEKAAKASER